MYALNFQILSNWRDLNHFVPTFSRNVPRKILGEFYCPVQREKGWFGVDKVSYVRYFTDNTPTCVLNVYHGTTQFLSLYVFKKTKYLTFLNGLVVNSLLIFIDNPDYHVQSWGHRREEAGVELFLLRRFIMHHNQPRK